MNENQKKHFNAIKEIEFWLCNSTNIEAYDRMEMARNIYKSIRDEEERDKERNHDQPEIPNALKSEFNMYLHDHRCPHCGFTDQFECGYVPVKTEK